MPATELQGSQGRRKKKMLQAYLILLRFADAVFFYKLKVFGNPVSSKSISAIFPIFAHFLSLCHILVILEILKIFHFIISVMVICDQ